MSLADLKISKRGVRSIQPKKSFGFLTWQLASALAVFVGLVTLMGCAGVTASSGGSSNSGVTITANPPSISFGSVPVGTTVSQSIILSNTGSSAVTFQASLTGQEFSVTGISGSQTINAGQQANFTAAFSPTSTGNATGSVAVTSASLSGPLTITLSGTGVAANGQLIANPSSVSFGTVVIGTTSSQNVSVTNSGNSSVTISSVTVNGSGYTTSGLNANTILTANQSGTLVVNFDPATSGSLSGTVSIASNAPSSPLQISLSGTGATASSHSVALNWQDSGTNISGYFIYRGTQAGGPYNKLNPSAAVTTTSYKDSAVAAGQVYYYVVTATTSNDIESTYSNQVSATIPSQ